MLIVIHISPFYLNIHPFRMEPTNFNADYLCNIQLCDDYLILLFKLHCIQMLFFIDLHVEARMYNRYVI